jgi:aryl-alcohol dehydrogenase-like predicted oxidoreductase
MQYRPLGSTGMTVSTLCLGSMMMGAWGETSQAECTAMVDLALDAGVNFVDTADVYAFGESEQLLGRAIKGRRHQLVVVSKFGNAMDADPNHRGGSRRWVTRAVEDSLRRLGTDWIDLYLVHQLDETTAFEVTLSALSDLVHQGKVRAVGTSTFPAERIVESQWTAARRGCEPISCEQPPYSVLARGVERAVLPTCRRYDMGVMVWSPLNGGWLSGKYRRGAPPPDGSRAQRHPDHFDYIASTSAAKLDAVEVLQRIAAQAGITLIELALAFTLAHPAVTSAIMGPRSVDQLKTQLSAADVVLDEDSLDAIDAVVAPGVNLNPADEGFIPVALTSAAERRRRQLS